MAVSRLPRVSNDIFNSCPQRRNRSRKRPGERKRLVWVVDDEMTMLSMLGVMFTSQHPTREQAYHHPAVGISNLVRFRRGSDREQQGSAPLLFRSLLALGTKRLTDSWFLETA